MLKPTQDKEAILTTEEFNNCERSGNSKVLIWSREHPDFDEWGFRIKRQQFIMESVAIEQIAKLERLGYHKGLYPSIEKTNHYPGLFIASEFLKNGKYKITEITNALTLKELPKEYTNHVPYMYWTDDSVNPRYLVVNWIGGIDDVYVGSKYTKQEYDRLIEHIEQCERKLHLVKLGQWKC